MTSSRWKIHQGVKTSLSGRKLWTGAGILGKYLGISNLQRIGQLTFFLLFFPSYKTTKINSRSARRLKISTLPLQEHNREYWSDFSSGRRGFAGQWYFRAELIWVQRGAKCGWLATLHREPWTAAAGPATFCWCPYRSIPCWTVCPTRRWRLWCWGRATSGKPVWGIHRFTSQGGKNEKEFNWMWEVFKHKLKFNSCLAGILEGNAGISRATAW